MSGLFGQIPDDDNEFDQRPHEGHEYRVRYKLAGGHVHCRVFSRPAGPFTFAKCGDLVVTVLEWPSFQLAFSGAEFLEEEENDDKTA